LNEGQKSLPRHIWEPDYFPSEKGATIITNWANCIHASQGTMAKLLDCCIGNYFVALVFGVAKLYSDRRVL
jgi:hypothetical protein